MDGIYNIYMGYLRGARWIDAAIGARGRGSRPVLTVQRPCTSR